MLRRLKQRLDSKVRDHTLPLYQQIKQEIRQNIHNKIWHSEQKLPSENELVGALQVSRMTVHRALRELTQEGLLHRVHGVGTFVAKPLRHASLITLQNIADEIEAAGFSHRCKVLSLKTIHASNSIASSMELKKTLHYFICVQYTIKTTLPFNSKIA